VNLAFKLADAAGNAALPPSLRVNPRLSTWIRFRADGAVEVRSGKVELGQGIATALAQIVADELDVALRDVHMVPACTGDSPDEAVTSGSLSLQESGRALRAACAEVRALCLAAAARQWNVDAATLSVQDGRIVAADLRTTTYGVLAQDGLLDRDATGAALPKPPHARRVIGRTAPRLDLPDKVFGQPRFVHDLDLPALTHGRVLRPASPGATLAAVDSAPVEAMRDVLAVVRDGDFVGVLARTERAASRAVVALAQHATWVGGASLPDADALPAWLLAQSAETAVVESRGHADATARGTGVHARYTRPFLAHASLAPSCALAQWHANGLDVWTHSQGIYNLRRDLALAFGLAEDAIVVRHVEGAGCYGHNAADDVAFDAARLAREAGGRPVRVQWSRADELAWAPFGPAMVVEIEARLGEDGRVQAWRQEVWSNGHSLRPGRARTPVLLGGWHVAPAFPRMPAIDAPLAAGGGSERNAVPGYAFPACEVVKHRVLAMPLRTSALRALGAFANVFAIESAMDELAQQAHSDPVAFRLRHLDDARARSVVQRAAQLAAWNAWRPRDGRGRGIGYARYKNTGAYCAVVAEIEAAERIRVRRLAIAVDVGEVVNPDGVANQIEGGALQAASWTLLEAVRFDATQVTSDDWERYPILRFSDVPEVTVEIIDRPDAPSLGAGEAALGPTAGAIANAVADALGVRVRDLPLTPERIRAAIA